MSVANHVDLMRIILLFVLLLLPAQLFAQSSEIEYGDAPYWAGSLPVGQASASGDAGYVYVDYNFAKVRLQEDANETFIAYRMHLLSPDALPLGNISLTWNPSATTQRVHHLRIIRGDEVIDVLEKQKFSIFQREGGLERSMLDGQLTAAIQVVGLRVGDILEFSQSTRNRDLVFGNRDFGVLFWEHKLAPGRFRLDLSWDEGQTPIWQASSDFTPHVQENSQSISVDMLNPAEFIPPSGAPQRFQIGRIIEYTDFQGWADVSRANFALYHNAANLTASPELQSMARQIALSNPDKAAQAKAALALVHENIRYVYAGMNGGNFRPASVAATWERRFGDCKGMTVLLLALLRELEIDAEPVLVQLRGGDGLDERLPGPAAFDHVLVRATINGEKFWLDGTRNSDTRLMRDTDTTLRWVLPISKTGADLEKIEYSPPSEPFELTHIDIKVPEDLEADADVTFRQVFRGQAAINLNKSLATRPKDAAQEYLKQVFSGSWLKPTIAEWRYDEVRGATEISLTGKGELEWHFNKSVSRGVSARLLLPAGGFYPPEKMRRGLNQDQSAPYLNPPHEFSCTLLNVRLPKVGRQHWELYTTEVDEVVRGQAYFRVSDLFGSRLALISSKRTIDHEVPASLANAVEREIEDFDSGKSWLETTANTTEHYSVLEEPMKVNDFSKLDLFEVADICKGEAN